MSELDTGERMGASYGSLTLYIKITLFYIHIDEIGLKSSVLLRYFNYIQESITQHIQMKDIKIKLL